MAAGLGLGGSGPAQISLIIWNLFQGKIYLTWTLSGVEVRKLLKLEKKRGHKGLLLFQAAGLGLEPRSATSKAAVLPLDDPAIKKVKNKFWAGNGARRVLFYRFINQTSVFPASSFILKSIYAPVRLLALFPQNKFWAGNGARTRNLLVGNEMLHQLSYPRLVPGSRIELLSHVFQTRAVTNLATLAKPILLIIFFQEKQYNFTQTVRLIQQFKLTFWQIY